MKRIINLWRMSNPKYNWMHVNYKVTHFEMRIVYLIVRLRDRFTRTTKGDKQ